MEQFPIVLKKIITIVNWKTYKPEEKNRIAKFCFSSGILLSNLRIFYLLLVHLEHYRNLVKYLCKGMSNFSQIFTHRKYIAPFIFEQSIQYESNKNEIDVCKICRKYRTCMKMVLSHMECTEC